jgi:hypothetical protein
MHRTIATISGNYSPNLLPNHVKPQQTCLLTMRLLVVVDRDTRTRTETSSESIFHLYGNELSAADGSNRSAANWQDPIGVTNTIGFLLLGLPPSRQDSVRISDLTKHHAQLQFISAFLGSMAAVRHEPVMHTGVPT